MEGCRPCFGDEKRPDSISAFKIEGLPGLAYAAIKLSLIQRDTQPRSRSGMTIKQVIKSPKAIIIFKVSSQHIMLLNSIHFSITNDAPSQKHPKPKSSVDTLSELVDLQPRLRHVGLLQEVQRHPHQVALDLVELGPDVLGRHHAVEDVSRLDALRR